MGSKKWVVLLFYFCNIRVFKNSVMVATFWRLVLLPPCDISQRTLLKFIPLVSLISHPIVSVGIRNKSEGNWQVSKLCLFWLMMLPASANGGKHLGKYFLGKAKAKPKNFLNFWRFFFLFVIGRFYANEKRPTKYPFSRNGEMEHKKEGGKGRRRCHRFPPLWLLPFPSFFSARKKMGESDGCLGVPIAIFTQTSLSYIQLLLLLLCVCAVMGLNMVHLALPPFPVFLFHEKKEITRSFPLSP